MMNLRLSLLVAPPLIALFSCGPSAEAASHLRNSFPTQESLIEATLAALTSGDDVALASYMVTREEWQELLWPEMPDKEHTSFEFVWGMSSRNSFKSRAQAIVEYGGLTFELVALEYAKDPEVYPSFTLHKGARALVRRSDTGEQGLLPIFDVFVELAGEWKLMNYDEF